MNTFSEWKSLGDALQNIQSEVTALLQHSVIRGNTNRQRRVIELQRNMMEFRSRMDDAACTEHFNNPLSTGLFYRRSPLTKGVL